MCLPPVRGWCVPADDGPKGPKRVVSVRKRRLAMIWMFLALLVSYYSICITELCHCRQYARSAEYDRRGEYGGGAK